MKQFTEPELEVISLSGEGIKGIEGIQDIYGIMPINISSIPEKGNDMGWA